MSSLDSEQASDDDSCVAREPLVAGPVPSVLVAAVDLVAAIGRVIPDVDLDVLVGEVRRLKGDLHGGVSDALVNLGNV